MATTNDPEPVPEATVVASRGFRFPVIDGVKLAARPLFDTTLGPDPRCGTVAIPQEISAEFAGQIVRFRPGERVELDDGVHHLVIHGVHAERRILLPHTCAEGPDNLGDDLELVYVRTASQQP